MNPTSILLSPSLRLSRLFRGRTLQRFVRCSANFPQRSPRYRSARYVKILFLLLISCSAEFRVMAQKINREQVVRRHNIKISKIDSLSSLSVGNGNFAFTVDATGMQSFPDAYVKGVPLGTQSVWGWHSFPNTEDVSIEEAQKTYDLEGRKISYTVQLKEPERAKKAVEYFRVNPHRLQLGNIGLELKMKDGRAATESDIKNIKQELNLWTGIITSSFTVDGDPVSVTTFCDQQKDALGFTIRSLLINADRLLVRVRIPEPSGQWKDAGNTYEGNTVQSFHEKTSRFTGFIHCQLDTMRYRINASWGNKAFFQKKDENYYLIHPYDAPEFRLNIHFTPDPDYTAMPDLDANANSKAWQRFWLSGGAVDFSGTNDPRAFEIERRTILSQYLTKIQCSADFPPQETGLTYNSWYGKPHLEMHWWHAVHYAQWGRVELMEKSLDWYFKVAAKARAIAQRQGLDGLRWQKMTDNNGDEAPSSVGAFLIWQQPHFIYMAELLYRAKPMAAVLNKYKNLLFATADFMASFPSYNAQTKKYNLGKGLIPAQECFEAVQTFNPTYELAYWSWALQTAQQWRKRLGLQPEKKWQTVIDNLASLPQRNGVYLATESTPDCYEPGSRYLTDHPAVLGAYSSLPAVHGLDKAIMRKTLDTVLKVWQWKDTWGWDFPLTAMTAARLHEPAIAVNTLLMPVKTNTYLVNGHNYQDDRLTIYLPGNGGVLNAVAFMCTGGDADKEKNIGFPKSWNVKWEGLKKLY